ncbi:glycosyltransferase family 2 protein [Acinetobacter indicus]|nr:glycosyltransferase family 2 protein [Acinetobacter indicus]
MFSIVIPVYNKEYSIGRTLESISEQSFKRFELVLVNDGSTDQSLKVINDFINTHPNLDIILIDQKNQGVSVARNVGVANSKYEFICFLDADDNWETVFLSTYNKYIDKYSDAGLWISGYKINNENSVMHLSEGYIDSFFLIFHLVKRSCIHPLYA